MRNIIARVAGPQLLMPCRSYSGAVNEASAGRAGWVAVAVSCTTIFAVGVGDPGLAVGTGVDGSGVGIGPTGSMAFLK
jgi:hypothetical protein